MPTFNVDFLAAGGTRHPSAADWDEASGVLAFGAARNVALWKPLDNSTFGIHALLTGHTDTVNVVKILPSSREVAPVILSCSADTSIRIWCPDTASPNGYKVAAILQEHEKSINAIAVLPEAGIFASSSADAEVKIWKINQDGENISATLRQVLSLKPKYFPLTLALARLPATKEAVLAVAGSKTFVQLYVSKQGHFEQAATLTGHEGWIRSLCFVQETSEPNSDLLLASASQDKYIRLWRLRHGEELPITSDALSDPSLGSIGRSLSNKAHRFETSGENCSVTFEALLLGHEDWIFTTRWHRHNNHIRLLSASADNSIAIWEADPTSGVWLCTVRLGEISAQKGATTATGSTGGFWIGLWGPDGRSVVSLGRTGGWRLWNHESSTDQWQQTTAVSGHTREVRGLAWAKDGSYLLSTSADQTTRLFGEWSRGSSSNSSQGTADERQITSWHELSRPQIHGYDLNCIDILTDNTFLSGADEKLLRAFTEPKGVAGLLEHLSGIKRTSSSPLPELASIPVLGLSNKAIAYEPESIDSPATQEAGAETAPTADLESSTHLLTTPPTEDTLSRSLLWPEIEKLYGHGHEITAVACQPPSASHNSSLIATACRASSADHAVIRLYDAANDWLEVRPSLKAHTLTVNRVRWSTDGRWLASVGRGREIVIWRLGSGEGGKAEVRMWSKLEKAHSRMILDVSWAPMGEPTVPTEENETLVFATASRDKTVAIWRISADDETSTIRKITTIGAQKPVMALAFLPKVAPGGGLVLAYATEDGAVYLARLAKGDLQIIGEVVQMPSEIAPAMAVSELAWRPEEERSVENAEHQGDVYQLAVASEDASLRIYRVDVSS